MTLTIRISYIIHLVTLTVGRMHSSLSDEVELCVVPQRLDTSMSITSENVGETTRVDRRYSVSPLHSWTSQQPSVYKKCMLLVHLSPAMCEIRHVIIFG